MGNRGDAGSRRNSAIDYILLDCRTSPSNELWRVVLPPQLFDAIVHYLEISGLYHASDDKTNSEEKVSFRARLLDKKLAEIWCREFEF